MRRENFLCDCSSMEHQFSLWIDDWDTPEHHELLCLEVSLCQSKPFFTRIWLAVKYIFGYRSKYGMWAEMIIDLKDKERLLNIINRWGEGK